MRYQAALRPDRSCLARRKGWPDRRCAPYAHPARCDTTRAQPRLGATEDSCAVARVIARAALITEARFAPPIHDIRAAETHVATPAYAQAAVQRRRKHHRLHVMLAPLVLIFVVFYFLMIRPQQQRMKALQATIDAVKKGDSVVTGGGLLGKVVKVDDKFVEFELAPERQGPRGQGTLAE